MIDWTKPLVVAGTDRVATVDGPIGRTGVWVSADWKGNGERRSRWVNEEGRSEFGDVEAVENAVTNAPPTPQIGPEHIEALAEAIAAWTPHPSDIAKVTHLVEVHPYLSKQEVLARPYTERAVRLAEIRAYLESL